MNDKTEETIHPDLGNYEQYIETRFVAGKAVSSEQMKEALFSLVKYVHKLEHRISYLEAHHKG